MPPAGSRKRILGLVAENENRVLEFASLGFSHYFARAGYEYQPIDLMTPTGTQDLADALKAGTVAFAFGMAGVGSQLAVKDVNLWTAYKTPFVGFWNDHPAYNYRQHSVVSPYILNAYHVLDHYDVALKYWPKANRKILLPTFSVLERHDSMSVPWNERKRKLLFAKSGNDPEAIRQSWRDFPKKLQDVLNALAARVLADRNIDLANAAEEQFAWAGHPASDVNMLMGVIAEVDRYIRAWRSDKLARALVNYPAVIVGRGWEYLQGTPATAEFRPPVNAYNFVLDCLQYRMIANSSPLWREGIHERIGHGMAVGAIVLTDRSIKGDRTFGGLPNYVGFEWQDALEESIELAWQRSTDDQDYVAASRKRIGQHHMDIHKDFVQAVEAAVEAMPG